MIAEAVLAVGFRELTFAAVAKRLGVAQATLYRHAANRDELVRLGVDLALRRTEWPDLEGPWRPLLERWALASWHAWERYPGAVVEVTRGVIPPSMIALSDRVGAALMERGFSARNAVLAVDLVFDLAADNRRGVETFDAEPAAPEQPAVRGLIERQCLSAPIAGDAGAAGVEQEIRAEMVRAIRAEPIEWFRGKLRVVLSGIERELAPAPQDARTKETR
ncbi:AcrR family transcriptional regulator [Thermocatellispora tengchongensis]|uniref:AcrR family transcriptional regulator n=1 Tax=Thermocatellispora tengchongensis TaxID=1073253 RepID=A0A840PAQ0_9ACTN|nr:helix-turn-helix domain-containing protein [Thermocatellispora tengchongensis]MBB5138464.1 AcrR family transcriptional regulator [Thermocatellispora tengchongensis]